MRLVILLLPICQLFVSAIPVVKYQNAKLIVGANYQLINQLFVESQTQCICQCFANETCLTATYIGTNQNCSLFSTKLNETDLQLATFEINASILSFINRTISSTIRQAPNIQWLFDGNLNDSFGNYPGISANGNIQWISPDYSGNRKAAYFANKSYVIVPYTLELIDTSFTVSTWIRLLSNRPLNTSEFGIFTHCENINDNNCLYMSIRYGKLFFSLNNNNVIGNSFLTSNIWYHVAYVYDRITLTQSVYINGQLDGVLSSTGIYQGNASQIWIGASPFTYMYPNPFAYMDELNFVPRAESADALLEEATLVVYYKFDNSFFDSGPNKIYNSSGTNVRFDVNGRVNQALLINSNNSFFQSTSFYRLGQSNYPYSFSLWIYPLSMNGTIVQLLSINNDWWSPMLGFDSSNHLVTQTWSGSVFYNVASNSFAMPLNVWTHVVATFSTTNGLRLFINGTMVNSTSSSHSHGASGTWNIMSIGACTPMIWCSNAETRIVANQFRGKIDEMRVYSRELTNMEIQAFATI
ncbi:unnamed protein product [Adineta ricciae]|uniref:Apple domain-containing protein n=1 Tax=Adineta ricciae TaxID=249248 RepID=A0A815J4F4_ADIRI|nr:unnamed protein product [Adineta ricciae]